MIRSSNLRNSFARENDASLAAKDFKQYRNPLAAFELLLEDRL